MRILGNVMIVVGVLCLPTIIFSVWGVILIALGCLIRLAFRRRDPAAADPR